MAVEAEVVDLLDPTSAQALVDQLDADFAELNRRGDAIIETAIQAYMGRAWIPLGFESWAALVEAHDGWQFRPQTREDRLPLIAAFRAEGLSLRAIGELVGANASTIMRDLGPVADATPDDTVTGADGKQYPSRRTVAATTQPEAEPMSRTDAGRLAEANGAGIERANVDDPQDHDHQLQEARDELLEKLVEIQQSANGIWLRCVEARAAGDDEVWEAGQAILRILVEDLRAVIPTGEVQR